MLPEKYINDLESSSRRSKILRDFLIAVTFLTSFLLIGPLVHEIAHVLTLEFKGCTHYLNAGFSILNGFRAEVTPLCSLGNAYLLIFYSIGYLTTLVFGAALNIFATERKNNKLSDFMAAAGTGMLLSVLTTIGSEGDLLNLLEIFNLGGYWQLVSLFIMLGVFTSSLKGVEILLRLERKERDTDEPVVVD